MCPDEGDVFICVNFVDFFDDSFTEPLFCIEPILWSFLWQKRTFLVVSLFAFSYFMVCFFLLSVIKGV